MDQIFLESAINYQLDSSKSKSSVTDSGYSKILLDEVLIHWQKNTVKQLPHTTDVLNIGNSRTILVSDDRFGILKLNFTQYTSSSCPTIRFIIEKTRRPCCDKFIFQHGEKREMASKKIVP